MFVANTFTDTMEEFELKFGRNLFGDGIDTKDFLQKFYNISF